MYKVDRVATGQADIADARCVALLHAIRAGIAFVSAAGELRDVMSGVLAAAGLATLADKAFAIRFKRDEQGQFQPATHAQWQAPGTPAGSIAWEAFSPAVAESLARSSALVVTAGDGREAGVALLGTGLRTMALALVTQAGEPWGAVGIASAKAGRVWTALDLLALETFVELFSSALLRSRYMQRLKAREKERALIVGFSRLRLEDGQHPDAAFQWLAESLADTGSQAAASVARIVIDGNELRSANFRVLPVTHASAIVIDGKGRGTIEIMQSSEAAAADLAGEPEEAQLFLDELGRQVALVLERLDAERKLALDNAILAAEREASPDGIVVADNEGRIISHNRRLLELCGIGQEMAMPAVESQFFACFAAQLVDGASVAARMRPLQANPDAAAHETFDLKDGRIFDLHAAPMKARDGTPLGRAWFFRDITELRHHQAEISRVTHTDPLTGQPNRGLFVEDLSLAFDALERGGNPFAVHYLDIDRFKDVNDAFGHRNGDLLLKAVARRLRGELRETDILARLGGDEFAILQPNVTNAEIAGGLATKLIELMKKPFLIGVTEIHLTISIGIVLSSAGHSSPDEMLARADLALYRAKDAGRDQYHFHVESLDHQVRERVVLYEDLRGGLERNEFELHYQPQVEIATGRIVGVEALARWNHPTRGLISPGVFIPIAEQSGLIRPVGRLGPRRSRPADARMDRSRMGAVRDRDQCLVRPDQGARQFRRDASTKSCAATNSTPTASSSN